MGSISLPKFNRRAFLKTGALATGSILASVAALHSANDQPGSSVEPAPINFDDLPIGSSPSPVDLPHFPDRLHAFVWRNWQLVPAQRLARVIRAKPSDLQPLAKAMGLPAQPRISNDQLRRSALTIIKRNWHLLPYTQLLELLDWTPEQMAFSLREDDFLYVKLGNLKPRCGPLKYAGLEAAARERQKEIRQILTQEFPEGIRLSADSLFTFIPELSVQRSSPGGARPLKGSCFSPRFCYSYFAPYGDPLLDPAINPYPDGYLAHLAESGVNGVWLQGVLTRLAPFPWDASRSEKYEVRLRNLRALTERARRHGISIYLYLNEPRALPSAFYAGRARFRGAAEGEYACLCTSHPEVLDYLKTALGTVAKAVPGLGGVFTITASENLTHCWSHYHGEQCPRCRERTPQQVIAELHRIFLDGLRETGQQIPLIAWDWGWPDAWAEGIIRALPAEITLMSVSEWDLPINRGGVEGRIGEYSISATGPGPRALRHWHLARQRGLKTIAKIQAGNTWELSAVPYIPAIENVARHAVNLRQEGVDGVMLGWTLGGYPSPNLEVVAEVGRDPASTPLLAMERIARRRFGAALTPLVVETWSRFSNAFSQYPFGSGLYSAPLQLGPANLLWLKPTGYRASMVGFPYDDLDSWCGNYPPEIFAEQLAKVADGFEQALRNLKSASANIHVSSSERAALEREMNVAEAAAIHFRSSSLQCRFVLARRALANDGPASTKEQNRKTMADVLHEEIALARRLYALQSRDARLGFEASNQYYYVPLDLAEKVINCRDLLNKLANGS